FSGKVLRNPSYQGSFFAVRHAEDDDARTKLLAEAVHKLAKGFAVGGCDLADDGFDAFDGLSGIGQIVELRQRAFALLIGKLCFELLDGVRKLFDVRENSVFPHIELMLKLSQDFGLFLKMLESADSCDGFNAADSRSDGFFADNF